MNKDIIVFITRALESVIESRSDPNEQGSRRHGVSLLNISEGLSLLLAGAC